MTPADALAVLRRLGEVPLDPLVEALRQVHAGGGHAPGASLLASLGAPGQPGETASEAASPGDYEAARRHFVAHAQRLREQALLADRLLDGIVRQGTRASEAWHPRELAVTCGRRSTAQTRFLLANHLDRTVTVRFRIGRLHGVHQQPATPVAAFDPPAPRLAPGAEQVIRMDIDLRTCDGPLAVLEFGVDVDGDEQLLATLWVRVVTREEAGHGSAAE